MSAVLKPQLTAADLERLLAARFPAQEYALFFEVPNATGARGTGWCDALVVSLWPSRGLLIHGFEIKVSRNDWLREMKDPGKAEAHARYCDRWNLLVADADIVKPGELPATWGLWAPRANALRCIAEPKPLTPAPIDRSFMAALARSAQAMATKAIARSSTVHELERRLKEQRDKFDAEINERVEHRLSHAARDLTALKDAVAEFEKRSGISIAANTWAAGGIGDAVRTVRELHARPSEHMKVARERLQMALDTIAAVEASRTIAVSDAPE